MASQVVDRRIVSQSGELAHFSAVQRTEVRRVDDALRADLRAALEAHFAGCRYVNVVDPAAGGRIEAEDLNDTDLLALRVHANEKYRQAVLVAQLDNLGKGASGAAVQNMELMLGLTVPAAREAVHA